MFLCCHEGSTLSLVAGNYYAITTSSLRRYIRVGCLVRRSSAARKEPGLVVSFSSSLECAPGRTSENIPSETVWKIGMRPNSGLQRPPTEAKRTRSAASWRQKRTAKKPSTIFQTVSEEEFSEVRHSLCPGVVGCSVANKIGGDHGLLERRRTAAAY